MRLKQNSLLEPLEIQNAKTSSATLKRDEYIEKEKLLLNLSGIEVFFRTERILSEINKAANLNLPSYLKRHTGNYISIFACYFNLCILRHKSNPSDYDIILSIYG